MSAGNRTAVTVVGLGSMGAALAEAFIAAGHPTTVWNRTPSKAAPLAVKGARHEEALADALAASPLVVACLSTYDATRAALQPAAAALAGRTLVTLNSGAPADARAMAAWATGHGARFLDGAVKDVPASVGRPETLLYYSGDKPVFDEHETTLRALGGDTVYLGPDADLAAVYEMAVGSTLLPTLVGLFQGAAVVQARGLQVSTLVPYTVKWLEMIGSVLPTLAEEIDTGDYTEPASSVGVFHDQIDAELRLGEETNVDVSWQAPMHELVRRAVDAGHASHSISTLVELLRKQQPAS